MEAALAQARLAVNTSLEALSDAQTEIAERSAAAQQAEAALAQRLGAWERERADLVRQLEEARQGGGHVGGSRHGGPTTGSLSASEDTVALAATVTALRQEARSREALLQAKCDELGRAQGLVTALHAQLLALGDGTGSSPRVGALATNTEAQSRVDDLERQLAEARALLETRDGPTDAPARRPSLSTSGGGGGGDLREEVSRLREELALERAAAANASRAFADELVSLQSSAEAAHRSLEARLEAERTSAAQLRAQCAQASAQAEQHREEASRLKQQGAAAVEQLRAEAARLQAAAAAAGASAGEGGGQGDGRHRTPYGLEGLDPPDGLDALRQQVADLTASRAELAQELTERMERSAGRIGQLQRALASAAHHTAGAEARWAQEKEAMLAQHATERDRLVSDLVAARDAAVAHAAPVILDAAALASLPDDQRMRLTLEADVRVAVMAKQAADASRKLQAAERERRRLADENAELREAARNSSLLALLGGVDSDALLGCAPSQAIDDVVTQGQALGALLASRVEAAVYDGVATLAQGTGITYASVEAATNAMAGHLRAAVGDGALPATAHVEAPGAAASGPAPYTTRY